MSVYVIRQSEDQNLCGLGEYVNLRGVYTDESQAQNKLKELRDLLNEKGYMKDGRSMNRYAYDILEIETDKDIDVFLGGYLE